VYELLLTYQYKYRKRTRKKRKREQKNITYMSRTDKAIMLLQLPYRNKEQIKTNAIL